MIRGIRLEELVQRLGLKKSKIYQLIGAGKLPKPYKVGTASIWIETEVDEAFRRLIELERISKS